jgi:LmbE family N-acetylglucosaminyl deacetylase
MTSILVRNACFYTSIPHYKTKARAADCTLDIPYLYYAQPMDGIDIFGKKVITQFYVDITGLMEQKLKMLACHQSQRNLWSGGALTHRGALCRRRWPIGPRFQLPFAHAIGFRRPV